MKENTGKVTSHINIPLGSFPCFQKQINFLLNCPAEAAIIISLRKAASGPAAMWAAFCNSHASRLRQREGQRKLDFPTDPSGSPIALIASDQGKLRKVKQTHLFSSCSLKPAKPAVSVVTQNQHRVHSTYRKPQQQNCELEGGSILY